MTTPDYSVLARGIVQELLARERELEATAKGQGLSPLGGKKYLLSEGLSALPVKGRQPDFVLQKTVAEPRAWLITMAGKIEAGAAAGGNCFPFAKFTVSWGASGANYETEVDGFSDQFLCVWGNQVTVKCEWDFEQFARMVIGLPGVAFPQRMMLQASIAPSEGAVTKAFRSFAFPTATPTGTLTTLLPVPYGAIGVIVRRPGTFYGTACDLFFGTQQGGGLTTESYLAADVLAAHNRGEYLSVPSMSDVVTVQAAAQAASDFKILEFEVQP